MATRYIGDAVIRITYRDRGDYAGTVCAPGRRCWHFENLWPPQVMTFGPVDSPRAYDEMAASAVSFGSYYTSRNRGAEVPDWAPSAEIADAIDEATSFALREDGSYEVRRSARGPVVPTIRVHPRRQRNPVAALWSRFGG